MSESSSDYQDTAGGVGAEAETEIVDAVAVREGSPSFPAAPAGPRGGLTTANPVAVQAAVVAVGGFAAGAATVAIVRRRRARRALHLRAKDRKALGRVRASRSFLVDIHLLNRE